MDVRPASPADTKAILAIARKLAAEFYPHLRFDGVKAGSQIRAAIASANHFAYVAAEGDELHAVLIAVTNENAWAQKSNSQVAMWWSDRAPYGVVLMRRYKTWVKNRPVIKAAGITADCDLPQETRNILYEMFEKKTHGGVWAWTR